MINSLALIIARIEKYDSDVAFIAKDFFDIAEYDAIRQAFSRLEKRGTIKRILAGIYYKAEYSNILGKIRPPSLESIALAIARKFNWTIAPSGNTALNQLGLSTQVSAKWSYISSGPYKKFQFENIEIEFKHRNDKEISKMSLETITLIQALKALGEKNISEKTINKLQGSLEPKSKEIILKEAMTTTNWVYEVIKEICGGNKNVLYNTNEA